MHIFNLFWPFWIFADSTVLEVLWRHRLRTKEIWIYYDVTPHHPWRGYDVIGWCHRTCTLSGRFFGPIYPYSPYFRDSEIRLFWFRDPEILRFFFRDSEIFKVSEIRDFSFLSPRFRELPIFLPRIRDFSFYNISKISICRVFTEPLGLQFS